MVIGWRYISLFIVLVEGFLLFREPNSAVLQVMFYVWFGIAFVLWSSWFADRMKSREKRKRDEFAEKPKWWRIGTDGEIEASFTQSIPDGAYGIVHFPNRDVVAWSESGYERLAHEAELEHQRVRDAAKLMEEYNQTAEAIRDELEEQRKEAERKYFEEIEEQERRLKELEARRQHGQF